MTVEYTACSLASLADWMANRAAEKRYSAGRQLRQKDAHTLQGEAFAYESVAEMLRHTKLTGDVSEAIDLLNAFIAAGGGDHMLPSRELLSRTQAFIERNTQKGEDRG